MTKIYLGVLSGTSMDAVDVAAFSFEDNNAQYIAGLSIALPPEYKQKYCAIIDSAHCDLVTLGELNRWTGELFAQAVLNFLTQNKLSNADIVGIGSHGQTIWHSPNGKIPFTMQLGDPSTIALKTGITTVADFRSADIAAGGQGAPLAPALHQALFADPIESRCIVNIGGISNISVLANETVIGFDTGPGNCLLDSWATQYFNIEFDRDGTISKSGTVLNNLLELCLADPYFNKPIPKSTGKEYFNLQWLQNKLRDSNTTTSKPQDVLATLTVLTATCITQSIQQYAPNSAVYLCGGGTKNTFLIESINALLGYSSQTTAELGVDPSWVEAALFAWLAKQNLDGNKLNLKNITGSKTPILLGGVYTSL